MATISPSAHATPPEVCFEAPQAGYAPSNSNDSDGASSCLNIGCVMDKTYSSRSRQTQLRYAPYPCPAPHRQQLHQANHGCQLQPLQLQLQGLQQCDGPTDSPLMQRRRQLVQMAINIANASLEMTLQQFSAACTARPGSPEAIAALDAAEAAMAQTTKMTNIASMLATRCLQATSNTVGLTAGAAAAAGGVQALQQVQQGQLQLMCPANQPALLQQGLHAAVFAGGAAPVPWGSQWFAQQQQAEEDVEDGEEVSSSCRCSSSVAA